MPGVPRLAAGVLRGPRAAALALIAFLVTAASLVSFAESYRGLYLWAARHGLSGVWAACWPVQVDTFVAVGELALFVALVDGWRMRSRAAGWLVILAGLAISVAGNIGHVTGHSAAVRATAAIPPVAAASALAAGLGVLKRIISQHRAALIAFRATLAAGNALSLNQLCERFSLTRAQATRVRELATADHNGQARSRN